MKGQTIALTIVGFLVGALAAGGIGVRVIEEVRTDDEATSLPAENVAPSDPETTIVGSTAVRVTSLVGDGAAITIDYDLVSLAPAPEPASEIGASQIRVDEWAVTTASGTYLGEPIGSGITTVHFELPPGESSIDVISADIIDPSIAYPLDAVFLLSEDVPQATIIDGVRATLVDVRVGDDVSTIRMQLDADDPGNLGLIVEGAGAGWGSSDLDVESLVWTLVWRDGAPPTTMRFRASGVRWVVDQGSHGVSVPGIR